MPHVLSQNGVPSASRHPPVAGVPHAAGVDPGVDEGGEGAARGHPQGVDATARHGLHRRVRGEQEDQRALDHGLLAARCPQSPAVKAPMCPCTLAAAGRRNVRKAE